MSNNTNLKLWEQVEKTPKELIEKVDAGDGKQLNTVASINRIKKATELFGVYGKNWGLKDIKHSEKRIFNTLILGELEAIFFYTHNDVKIEFEISNSTPIVSQEDKKLKVNYTYRKALETDTITKALSRLGFNADIYTDGELVASTAQQDELAELDLVQIKSEGEDATQS
jgi:hypothetical protein